MCVNLTFNSHGLSPKGSPLEALREAARLRRKEGYRPGSRKNLISCQTLFIQFALVYDVDLYAPRLDDFGAFAELLLISGRSPATVKNYLPAIKSLFQEWRAASVVKDLTSPAWTLTLRAISYSAGPQPDNRSAITLEDLTRLVAVCNTDPSLVPLRVALVFGFLGYLRISNMTPPTAQSFDPPRCPTLRTRVTTRPKVDQDASDTARGDHHPPLLPVRPAHLPSSRMEPIPAHASRRQP